MGTPFTNALERKEMVPVCVCVCVHTCKRQRGSMTVGGWACVVRPVSLADWLPAPGLLLL